MNEESDKNGHHVAERVCALARRGDWETVESMARAERSKAGLRAVRGFGRWITHPAGVVVAQSRTQTGRLLSAVASLFRPKERGSKVTPAAMVLASLLTASGASAFYPMDIENNARWIVLDGLAMPPGRAQMAVEIVDLRTVDLSSELPGASAVCGTVEFRHDDEGRAKFVLFYISDRGGTPATVSRPFFYAPDASESIDSDGRTAQAACGSGADQL